MNDYKKRLIVAVCDVRRKLEGKGDSVHGAYLALIEAAEANRVSLTHVDMLLNVSRNKYGSMLVERFVNGDINLSLLCALASRDDLEFITRFIADLMESGKLSGYICLYKEAGSEVDAYLVHYQADSAQGDTRKQLNGKTYELKESIYHHNARAIVQHLSSGVILDNDFPVAKEAVISAIGEYHV